MVNLQKIDDSSVKFVFTDSDHYLVGNGEIVVPINSLSLVIDESEMVTFKKSATGDPFISFRADNSNLGTKEAIEQFYKENMVGAGGLSEEEVQDMIDSATSGMPSSQVVEQLRTDVNTISGNTYTKTQIDGFLDNATTMLTTISGDVQTNAANIQDINDTIDEKEEVIASALTKLNQDVADIDAKEEVIASALTEVNQSLTNHADNANLHFSGTQKSNYDYLEGLYYVDDNWDVMPQTAFDDFTNDYSIAMGQFDQRIAANASAVTAVSNNLQTLSGAVIDNEYTVSQSLNDLNTRKQDVLTAGSGIEISGNVISAIGGGSVTVDDALSTTSENPVANSAITNGFNNYTCFSDSLNGEVRYFSFRTPNRPNGNISISNFSINGRCPLTKSNGTNEYIDKFSLVETSAITTSMTSSSTDAQVPSAKAVYDAIQAGGGGGVTVDSTLDTSSTNPVANSAITTAINAKQDALHVYTENRDLATAELHSNNSSLIFNAGGASITANNGFGVNTFNVAGSGVTINGENVVTDGMITTAITSGSTDSEVPTAKAVYNTLGGLKLVSLTQAQYDALSTKDDNTLYIVTDVGS